MREGKGGKDRVVMLPRAIEAPLRTQLTRTRALWDADRRRGVPGVEMPQAIAAKYPRAGETWRGTGCFPQMLSRRTRTRASFVGTTCTRSGWGVH